MKTYRVDKFFAYARARHEIYLKRASGQPAPWTKDKILANHRFTNVFRELDKTTVWFRKNVREPLFDKPEVLLATVMFRLLNRISVGEAIFCQPEFLRSGQRQHATAFEAYLDTGDIKALKAAIKKFLPRGPYTTGAYIISSPPGYVKLDGMLKVIDDFAKRRCDKPTCGHDDWRCTARWLHKNVDDQKLENLWNWLRGFDYLGAFHSYEIVTDLRHTTLLDRASDINTWANVGPGAVRGLNRVHGRQREVKGRKGWGGSIPTEQALEEMVQLLKCSRAKTYWPKSKNYPAWELRDVEHTLCEFDKYERVRLGEGRPRGKFP